jgi:RNA polymerase sigma-70 factor (ECF subfamily)
MTTDRIIHEYGTLVSSMCRRMIQDEDTAKDAAQEVWMAVIKSLPSFQGKSKISTWIYTIAYRVIRNFA